MLFKVMVWPILLFTPSSIFHPVFLNYHVVYVGSMAGTVLGSMPGTVLGSMPGTVLDICQVLC